MHDFQDRGEDNSWLVVFEQRLQFSLGDAKAAKSTSMTKNRIEQPYHEQGQPKPQKVMCAALDLRISGTCGAQSVPASRKSKWSSLNHAPTESKPTCHSKALERHCFFWVLDAMLCNFKHFVVGVASTLPSTQAVVIRMKFARTCWAVGAVELRATYSWLQKKLTALSSMVLVYSKKSCFDTAGCELNKTPGITLSPEVRASCWR